MKHRKCRLFAVACCRLIDPPLQDPRCQHAIEVAERRADGLVGDSVLEAAGAEAAKVVEERVNNPQVIAEAKEIVSRLNLSDRAAQSLQQTLREGMESAAKYAVEPNAYQAALYTSITVGPLSKLTQECCEQRQGELLRDIFGNPFRPVTFEPAWRTERCVAIAEEIYATRDFSQLASLADALQEASCDCPEILDHCRSPGPHVRGCWVVDLVLNKE